MKKFSLVLSMALFLSISEVFAQTGSTNDIVTSKETNDITLANSALSFNILGSIMGLFSDDHVVTAQINYELSIFRPMTLLFSYSYLTDLGATTVNAGRIDLCYYFNNRAPDGFSISLGIGGGVQAEEWEDYDSFTKTVISNWTEYQPYLFLETYISYKWMPFANKTNYSGFFIEPKVGLIVNTSKQILPALVGNMGWAF